MKRLIVIASAAFAVVAALLLLPGLAEAHNWNIEDSCDELSVSWSDFGQSPTDITVTVDGSTTVIPATGNGSQSFPWSSTTGHDWTVSTTNPDINPNTESGHQEPCTDTTEVTTSTTSPPESTTTTPSTSTEPPSTSSPTTTATPSTSTTTSPPSSEPSTTSTVPPTTSPGPSTTVPGPSPSTTIPSTVPTPTPPNRPSSTPPSNMPALPATL